MGQHFYSGKSIVAVLACMAIGSCQSPSRNAPVSKQTASIAHAKPVAGAKPLVDFSRGAGGFPLTTEHLPTTCDALVASLSTGYRSRVEVANPTAPTVTASAERYPHLNSLAIDLSGAKIKSNYRPSTLKGMPKFRGEELHVDHLSYVAKPLQYIDGKTNLEIKADDVALARIRAHGEQSTLVITDAKNGEVNFEVPISDLRTMMLVSTKASAGKAGFNVTDVQMNLKNDGSRALVADAHVGGWWLFVPATFKLSARIDVDDDFNAHFSNVSCSGDDVGGKLLAGFIDHAMKKYDGRVVPLASFPGNHIKIHDLHISIDDSLRVYVAFGS